MNIYVGNLNWNMTSDDLQNLFTPFGEVTSAKIVTDKFNNDRSKGFGFVEMSSDEEAQKAIEMFNEKEIDGRKIMVNEARPMEERRPGGGGGGFGGGRSGGGGFGGGRSGGDRGGYDRRGR